MEEILFLEKLRSMGIRLWVEGDKLRFRAPGSGLPAEIRAELTERKPRLLKLLGGLESREKSRPALTPRMSRAQEVPPSFAQQRLWFLDQLQPGLSTYNIYDVVEISHEVNIAALQRAVNELVRRHEILRTTFPSVNGAPVQRIAPFQPAVLQVTDLSGLAPEEREQQVHLRKMDWANMPFDLAVGPVFRVALLRLRPESYLWMLAIHHIASDDWSKKLLDQELETLYTAFAEGRPSPLPELTVQWSDFTEWQHAWMQGEVLERYVRYWSQQLGGELPGLRLPGSSSRQQPPRGKNAQFIFSRELSSRMRAFAEREGATLFMMALAAYAVLLCRYTRQDEVVIGSPIAERDDVETEKLIGFLLNSLPLRVRVDPALSFREILARVRDTCLDAYAHQTVPYETLTARLQLDHTPQGNPFFGAMLVFLNTPPIQRTSSRLWGSRPDWEGTLGEIPEEGIGSFSAEESNGTTKFDLSVTLTDYASAIRGKVEYDSDIFAERAMAAFIEQLQWLLFAGIADAGAPIGELDALGPRQYATVINGYSKGEDAPLNTACLHHFLEQSAKQQPNNIAIECYGETVSYAELERRAEAFSQHIKGLGAGPGQRVSLLMDRSIALFVALLGVLKSGAAYAPMDPSYPPDRLQMQLADAAPLMLITTRSLRSMLPSFKGSVLLMDAHLPLHADGTAAAVLTVQPGADDLACILYTSGSTGQPKGVELTHAALVNYGDGAARDYAVTSSDRVLQFASISFDASLEETMVAFARAARLVLRPERMLDTSDRFWEFCEKLRLTVLVLPTAYWHELIASLPGRKLPSSLRCVIIGGERAVPEKLLAWHRHVGSQISLFNTYGPTEGTIAVTRCLLPPLLESKAVGEVPIGKPVANTAVYLLDSGMQPVAPGIPGELFLGGMAVARSYIAKPALTAERFVPDPYGAAPGARLYRTGDLARFLPDGALEYLGRVDAQLKIRGNRVEPREIELILGADPSIADVFVWVREGESGDRRLVAYVVAASGHSVDSELLRMEVGQRLPSYMVPSAIVVIPSLPLSTNGKVDVRRLPAPDLSIGANGASATRRSPRTPVEETAFEVWRSVLGVKELGIDDNFFALGGHSLLATRVVARINQALQVDVPLRWLFEASSVASFSVLVEELLSTADVQKESTVTLQDAGQMLQGLEDLSDLELQALLEEENDTGTSVV